MIADFEHPVVGNYRGFAHPIKYIRMPGPTPFAAPPFSQLADDVLAELLLSPEQIAALKAQRTVF